MDSNVPYPFTLTYFRKHESTDNPYRHNNYRPLNSIYNVHIVNNPADAATQISQGPGLLKMSKLKSKLFNKDFQTWYLIGWQHSCRPIRGHVKNPCSLTRNLTWIVLSNPGPSGELGQYRGGYHRPRPFRR